MRFATIAATAAIFAPTVVSADGVLGFALGTKMGDGNCKSQSDYEADFEAISSHSGSKLVRGYAASDCDAAKNILPAAKSKGFQVVLGIWPDVQESFDADTKAITEHAGDYADQIYGVTVGSETLYRGNFTGEELLSKIKEVKGMLGDKIKVGTADSWNKWADGTGDAVIKGGVDMIFVNAFGYWQGQDINNATHTYADDLMQAFKHIQSVAGNTNIELWNGETGWPTDGATDYEDAKAGTNNAKRYYDEGVCGLIGWGYNVFSFEAFDEPWKPSSVGDNGQAKDETKWGVMKADRTPKFELDCNKI
ncbi:putative glucan 1,3-beta-glucosidase [Pseudovirgaria hyperparasitica]|uniref:glucan 1,3-beta-glucosidase n=1 Tax=Pseudovirgaria hyperparasitica TaxID=470096 RepID=A0A6A6WI90_9PEZI|nr:putative glucan 1,3-beta-glucosidase [Pseudovirgaria hyperparasitica]KAF2761770.1 putative glucan 1,3-beta-glucosidase [Pseudovirgaria hyperparasitica]